MTREDIIAKVKSTLAEEFEVEETVITDDAVIYDTLQLDSLSLVDLVAVIQYTFKVKIPVEDLPKVKTFKDITKLECNENFVYESVPGTAVMGFKETDKGVEFSVEGESDAQITLGLLENTEYSVFVNGSSIGKMSTNLGGKLNLSVELSQGGKAQVRVEK